MTVSVANTNLTDDFNSWRLRTNLLATSMSNNAVTAWRAGSSARGKSVTGNSHVKGTFSALELRATTLKGGNAAMGQVTSNGAITIASNTSVTGTSLSVAANTTFTGNVIFNTAGTDRVNLGDVSRVIVSGGAAGQFLRIQGPAADNPQFKALTLRDITDLSSNSADIILSGANTTFSATGARNSPALILAGGSNSGADRFKIYAADNTAAGDDDLVINLVDNVGDSKLSINNLANTVMATIDSRGTISANGATFTEDVTFTGAAANLGWDKSSNTLEFQDNAKALFGNDSDLSIYHTGSASYIDDLGTGNLYIRSNEVRINKYTGEQMIRATADADVSLYHDGSLKLATKADGVDITGELQSDSLDVDGAADISGTATLGAVTVTGAATLNGDVTLGNASTDTITVKGNIANGVFTGASAFNGGVTIGNANTDTLTVNANTTFNSGVNISSGSAVSAPTGTFTALVSTGSASLNGTTQLGDASTDIITTRGNFANASFNGNLMLNGSADLLVDGTLVISENGKLHANNAITNGTIKGVMLENSGVSAASYGSSSAIPVVTVDAQGLVTSVTTATVAGVTGLTYTAANNNIRISTATGTTYDDVIDPATASVKGVASFNSADFTVSTGAVSLASTITTAHTFDNDITFNGADYDVVWDKSANALEFADNTKATFGDGNDLSIYHNGSHNYIDSVAGKNLLLRGDNIVYITGAGSTPISASFDVDGSVHLYYNGSKKFETTNAGIDVTGTATTDGAYHDGDVQFVGANYGVLWDKSDNALEFSDNAKATFGGSGDLQIYHNETVSYIRDTGTGSLFIDTNGVAVHLISDGSYTNGKMASFNKDGAVNLYYDNAEKLATESWGVDITGELQADSLDIDGNADISGNLTIGGTLAGAIEADTIIPAASSDTEVFLAFFESATGAQGIKTDTGLTYNASTNTLIVPHISSGGNITVSGSLIGNVTGNVSGTAATVTGATQSAITAVGTLTSITTSGNITVSGTVDGRDVGADGTKLDSIESGATADQSNAEIRAAVEAATDSNVFTDADHTKLNGIEASATADQSAAEILTAIKTVDGTGTGLDADLLDGVEASQFLRSDAADAKTSGDLTINDNIKLSFGSNQDVDFYYTGTYLYTDFPTTAREWYVRDGTANRFTFQVDNGEFTATGDITAFSDVRVKENIELIQSPIDKVKQINGYTYNRNDVESDKRYAGVIAQEVEKVLPEVVSEDDDGMKSVAYGNMVGLLIEAIKDQQKQIDELKEIINGNG